MNIFASIKHFFAPKNDLSLTNEKAWNPTLWNLSGAESPSGENVSEYSALTYSAIWNAVSLISGTVSTLPLHLIKKDGKNKSLASEKPLFRVLYAQPNPYMTAMSMREAMVSHLLLWGNAYAEIVRDSYGRVNGLWPISPNRIKPEWQSGQLIYKISVDSDEIIMPRERILHIPGLGFDGFVGYSVVAMARKAIGLGMAMETFGSRFFGSGTHPGVIVSHPGVLKDPTKLRDSLASSYSGLGQSHRLMLLEEGMKLEAIGIPPNDSQFIESRQFQITDIARWFNLPVHKLKEMTKSSFNNIESEQISFVTDSILPWLIRLEQNYNIQLLTMIEQTREALFFKHNVEGLLRGDVASRGQFYKEMFNIGAFSINDIREYEDLNPIDGGDEHFVPMNMIPLSKLDDYLASGSTAEPVEEDTNAVQPQPVQTDDKKNRKQVRCNPGRIDPVPVR